MDQDWDSVTYLRKKAPKASSQKTPQAINQAKREGLQVDTNKKYNAGTNKHAGTTLNTKKLDDEHDELAHKTVDLSVGRAIQQARQAKGMNQKDLATKCNEKIQVVNEYESGKAIPNQQILGKLERALGVKLRGSGIGQPLQPKAPKGKK